MSFMIEKMKGLFAYINWNNLIVWGKNILEFLDEIF